MFCNWRRERDLKREGERLRERLKEGEIERDIKREGERLRERDLKIEGERLRET